MAEKIFGEYTQTLNELTRNCNMVWKEIQTSSHVLSQQVRTIEYVESPEDLIYRLVPDFIDIFKERLGNAIQSNREYGRHSIFKTRLEGIFENYTFAIVSEFLLRGNMSSAYRAMDKYAGDMGDFYDGVLFARQVFVDQSGKQMRSPKQRAVFWRRFVWGTSAWEDTLKLRLGAWRDKAPYWIWLEYGNETNELAYPHFYGTGFFWNALQDIRLRYLSNISQKKEADTEEEDYSLIFEKVANQAVLDFLRNPSAYAPGTILQRFYYEVKKAYYEFRVTPGSRLGFRKSRRQ